MDLKTIYNLYSTRYSFELFYQFLNSRLQCNFFLNGGNKQLNSIKREEINCHYGDIRVDLPVMVGNENSKYRIAILGLEPRDSNKKFNIERHKNYVYGTPFGIEYWNEKNKYYKSFNGLLNREDCFLYFTDVVKEYEVLESKMIADKNARKSFWIKAEQSENIHFLKEEMKLFNPTHIIALGNETYAFVKKYFGEKAVKVIHPNARKNKLNNENAWDIAQKQIGSIFR